MWTSAEEALKKIDAFRPQVVLMDINLPGMSGIEATARIKQHLPEIQVIMVTVYRDHDQIFAALKAGASGYLLKRSTPEEVRQAIRDVRSGGAPMSAEIARRVVEAFHQPVKAPEAEDGQALQARDRDPRAPHQGPRQQGNRRPSCHQRGNRARPSAAGL